MAKRRRKRPTRASAHRKVLNAQRHHYPALLEYQGGGCALCGRPPSETRKLDMDHDHTAMEVRGLLCVPCNRALNSRLTPRWLRAAAYYLENPPFAGYIADLEEGVKETHA